MKEREAAALEAWLRSVTHQVPPAFRKDQWMGQGNKGASEGPGFPHSLRHTAGLAILLSTNTSDEPNEVNMVSTILQKGALDTCSHFLVQPWQQGKHSLGFRGEIIRDLRRKQTEAGCLIAPPPRLPSEFQQTASICLHSSHQGSPARTSHTGTLTG